MFASCFGQPNSQNVQQFGSDSHKTSYIISRFSPPTVRLQFTRPHQRFNVKLIVAQRASWWRGTVVERRSLTGELSLSCARPAADG